MEHRRRINDQRGWLGRNISVGDIIAVCTAAIMVISSYFALEKGVEAANQKAQQLEGRIERAELRTKEDLKDIKDMIRDLSKKADLIQGQLLLERKENGY